MVYRYTSSSATETIGYESLYRAAEILSKSKRLHPCCVADHRQKQTIPQTPHKQSWKTQTNRFSSKSKATKNPPTASFNVKTESIKYN